MNNCPQYLAFCSIMPITGPYMYINESPVVSIMHHNAEYCDHWLIDTSWLKRPKAATMWLRHIWHWLRQWSIWHFEFKNSVIFLAQIYFGWKLCFLQLFCLTFLTKLFLCYVFDKKICYDFDQTFFFMFLTKLFFYVFDSTFFLTFCQNLFFFGQTSFGKLHLVKLHLANFIWRNFICRNFIWRRLARPIHSLAWSGSSLATPVALICFQMAGQTHKHTLAQLYCR